MVSSGGVDTVLVGNDFPELKIRGEKNYYYFFRQIKNEMTFESRDRINYDETKLQNSVFIKIRFSDPCSKISCYYYCIACFCTHMTKLPLLLLIFIFTEKIMSQNNAINETDLHRGPKIVLKVPGISYIVLIYHPNFPFLKKIK